MKNKCKCGHEDWKHYAKIDVCNYCTCKKFEPQEIGVLKNKGCGNIFKHGVNGTLLP